MAISTRAPAALPVCRMVKESYTSVSANWPAVLKMSWAWVLILWPVRAMLMHILREATHLSSGVIATWLLFLAAFSAGTASIAVAWHRLILLGEQPPPFYLRVGGPVPPYLARLLLIGVIGGATALVWTFLLSLLLIPFLVLHLPVSSSAPEVLSFLIVILTTLVVSPIAVSLPGVAVGRPMSLRETMRVTKGNVWRMFGGAVLVYLPAYVIGLIFRLIVSDGEGRIPASLALDFVNFISAIAGMGFLSLCYRFFIRTGQE